MSRQAVSLLTLSVLAAAAITAQTFVAPGGGVATAAGNALGVAKSDAASGDNVPVAVLGTAVVTASAAIAKGAYVQVAANGKAVTHTTGVAVGIALEAATAADQSIEILFIPNVPAAA